MNVEKIEILGINVQDLDDAIKKFSDILGTTFHKFASDFSEEMESVNSSYQGTHSRAAIDRRGFIELVESTPPVEREAVRNIHFKVPDLEEAVEETTLKGYRLIDVVHLGGLREAIFNPDDLCGVRLCFVEYSEPTLVDAMLAIESRP